MTNAPQHKGDAVRLARRLRGRALPATILHVRPCGSLDGVGMCDSDAACPRDKPRAVSSQGRRSGGPHRPRHLMLQSWLSRVSAKAAEASLMALARGRGLTSDRDITCDDESVEDDLSVACA